MPSKNTAQPGSDLLYCQLPCLPAISDGYARRPSGSLATEIRLFIRRRLNVKQVRAFKNLSNRLMDRILAFFETKGQSKSSTALQSNYRLNSGDEVRVRSKEEIMATLNHWGQLKGCTFIPEMSNYCGTKQRVLKRLERFVDERDYQVKTAHGIVLLEGVYCQGTSDYGRCDRTCFYFWREEWLEKLDDQASLPG